jgi:catechol 2,3-dioxygenase-like lactoylglutathione lyase family enzyme
MRRLTLYFLLVITSMGTGFGQSAAPPNAVKLTKYILGVADLDKSVAFYRALGIELDGAADLKKPAVANAGLLSLTGTPPGTMFRNAMLKIPGADFALELTEFTGTELHPGRPRMQDPGAVMLVLFVRDVETAFTTAKKAGAEVVTTGGAPVRAGEKSSYRGVIVKDPDGFYVELNQPGTIPASTAPPTSNIVSARSLWLVADAEKAAQFYRDRFGAEVTIGAWGAVPEAMKMMGTPTAQGRIGDVKLSGNTYPWRFLELRNVDRKPYALRIPDPGAPALGFQVRDMDTAVAAIKAAGGSVISGGGQIAKRANGSAGGFVRDPFGILLELAQPAPQK